MFVYRISKKEYIHDLSGMGAALYGGRWNPKSLKMVYTAGNIALSYVEFLVHNFHILNKTHVCLARIKIHDEDSIDSIRLSDLPTNWDKNNAFFKITQEIGEKFISKGRKYILKVPSVVVPGEFNYLINPNHKLHSKTKIQDLIDPFRFDPRLLNRN